MDYEKAYKEAIKRAKAIIEVAEKEEEVYKSAITIFPELYESDDERVRKAILELVRQSSEVLDRQNQNNMIAWLEKQGEQKPTDKVEPKFHEGEWIISNDKKSTYQVIEVKRGIYVIRDNVDNHEYHIGIEECEKSGRLFTIQDAKDGDVLVASDSSIFIFKEVRGSSCKHYIALTSDNEIQVNTKLDKFWETARGVKPSTKEQRDTLLKAIADAGYTFYFEKKELKKIEKKSQRMVSAEAKEALYDKPTDRRNEKTGS